MKEIKEDRLQKYVTSFFSLYYRDRKKFLFGVGVLIGIIVIFLFVFTSKPKENPEISVRFTEALGLYTTGNIAQAEERFLELTRRFPNQKLGIKAQFYLGHIYFNTQRYDEARRAFSNFYSKNKKDPVLSPSALFGIANSYEEVKEIKKAAEFYQKVAQDYKKSHFAPIALLSAGRCYKNLGDYKKARKLYERIVKDYPNDPAKEEAKAEISYLTTQEGKIRIR